MARSRRFLTVFIFFIIGTSLGAGVNYLRLKKAREVFAEKRMGLEDKIGLYQKKYSEAKARSKGLLRTKIRLEGDIRGLQKAIAESEEKLAALVSEKKALEEALDEKSTTLTAKIEDLSKEKQKLMDDYQELKRSHKETVQAYEKDVKGLQEEKREVEANLKRMNAKFDRCVSHNAELTDVATELLDSYEDKGVMASLLQKEPLTQIKKVKLEQFVQEYREKIEKDRIKDEAARGKGS